MRIWCRIELIDGEATRLATASTCFNTIRLAMCECKETLQASLRLALTEAGGFDEAAVAT